MLKKTILFFACIVIASASILSPIEKQFLKEKFGNKTFLFNESSVGQFNFTKTLFKVQLPLLAYNYSALEPVISEEIMRIHHSKHHAAYVNNLNIAQEKLRDAIKARNLSAIISLGNDIKFNGGGHISHSIFWTILTPNGTSEPEGKLAEAINRDFGSFKKFVELLTKASVSLQGSGWGWLGYNKQFKRLEIAVASNQDPLLETRGLFPLFGIDVWEHAYYLQYKNDRAKYVQSIFKIANWRKVEEYFNKHSE